MVKCFFRNAFSHVSNWRSSILKKCERLNTKLAAHLGVWDQISYNNNKICVNLYRILRGQVDRVQDYKREVKGSNPGKETES